MSAQKTGMNPHLHNLFFSLYHSAKRKQEEFSKLKCPTYQQRDNASIPRKILEMLLSKMARNMSKEEDALLLSLLKDLGSDLKEVSEHTKVTLTDHTLYRLVSHIFEGETRIHINKKQLIIVMGDLIQMPVETIVSPDSTKMMMDRGIPSIIRLWGGEKIREEAQKIVGVTIGSVIVTESGYLPYKFILHAAIMEPHKETTRDNIHKAIDNVFKKIDELNVKSVAFPAFGTATVKFPYDTCAKVMLDLIIRNMQKNPANLASGLEKVMITLYNREAYQCFINQFDVLNDIYQLKIEKDM